TLESFSCRLGKSTSIDEPLCHFGCWLESAPPSWLASDNGVDPSAEDIEIAGLTRRLRSQAIDDKIRDEIIKKWLVRSPSSRNISELIHSLPLPFRHPGRLGR